MNVAVAVFGLNFKAYDSNSQIDKSYGEIKAFQKVQGNGKAKELGTHPCTEEELGLDGSTNSKFMPMNPEKALFINGRASGIFVCIDK